MSVIAGIFSERIRSSYRTVFCYIVSCLSVTNIFSILGIMRNLNVSGILSITSALNIHVSNRLGNP